ncbi:MAG: hypothetical protein JSV33_02410 [bacterium]|nr:MAG: hypothetical protein JSV33_02410 [bacterium]
MARSISTSHGSEQASLIGNGKILTIFSDMIQWQVLYCSSIIVTILKKEDEMKRNIIACSLVLLVLLPAGNPDCQTAQVYKHPLLNFQFEASPNWNRVSRPEDKMIFEVMDPDSIVHVVLWYTTTMQDAHAYLCKMAGMKDLVVGEKPSKIRIKEHDAWVLFVPGRIYDVPVRTFLAVIQHGKSVRHPKENALYIVQIWCPENVYERHMQRMEDILASIEITEPIHVSYNQQVYALYPQIFDHVPDIPSPLTTENGMEIVTCITHDDRYALVPVTIENGEPLDYKNNHWWGKGRQLEVDTLDFPTLAKTGLHSENELDQIVSITGKPITEITRIGRPDAYSRQGFIGHDEDIVSVLKGDNRLVDQLGSTHPQIAGPLFHVFNVILSVKKDSERGNVKGILYNKRKIYLKFWGAKGWQESIFSDEILGYWEIEIRRELDQEEQAFLSRRYSDLTEEEMAELKEKLSYIHTGEIVPFYIMRYGFYEGHTGYRADPISISLIFGLKSMEEIENAFEGVLYKKLTNHFTKEDLNK